MFAPLSAALALFEQADFRCYWEHYVWARYLRYRPDPLPRGAIAIDFVLPCADAVAAVCTKAGVPRAGRESKAQQ